MCVRVRVCECVCVSDEGSFSAAAAAISIKCITKTTIDHYSPPKMTVTSEVQGSQGCLTLCLLGCPWFGKAAEGRPGAPAPRAVAVRVLPRGWGFVHRVGEEAAVDRGVSSGLAASKFAADSALEAAASHGRGRLSPGPACRGGELSVPKARGFQLC